MADEDLPDQSYPGPDGDQPSYIDYEAFLAPDFDPAAFANSLVLSTNDPNDPNIASLDLATPLSRVLFDIQEIDAHIDLLTSRSAVPLLTHTKNQNEASAQLLTDLQPQVDSLNASYQQLERQVLQKHAEADEVRQVALRLWDTLKLGRSVGRCLQLGRQLEVQYGEVGAGPTAAAVSSDGDHRALVRCAHTILALREILRQTAPGDEGHGLDKVDAIRSLQDTVITPIEKAVRETADRIVREFSLGSSSGSLTFSQSEEAKARTVSALVTLYLISPLPTSKNETWTPATLILSLETYLRATLQSSIAALARSLAALPTLERTLVEVSARCQNIVALEAVLASTKAPTHPLVSSANGSSSLLQPLLAKLETGSLPAYFWRSLASHLSPRVQDLMTRGGVAARTLRTNKTNVGDAIRECVVRGMSGTTTPGKGGKGAKGGSLSSVANNNWEREIAVMVGSVTGHLGR